MSPFKGKTASILARGESLTGHARSAEYRILADKQGQRDVSGIDLDLRQRFVDKDRSEEHTSEALGD